MNYVEALQSMGFSESQFSIWDDGAGPYIKTWTATAPQPTAEVITLAWNALVADPARLLQIAKADKVSAVLLDTQSQIMAAYPLHKQLNISNGAYGYTADDKTTMIAFIDNIRKAGKDKEAAINAATTIDAVNAA